MQKNYSNTFEESFNFIEEISFYIVYIPFSFAITEI